MVKADNDGKMHSCKKWQKVYLLFFYNRVNRKVVLPFLEKFFTYIGFIDRTKPETGK